jgi:hypothetical protein
VPFTDLDQKGPCQVRDIGPTCSGLDSHLCISMFGPRGEPLRGSYLENQTPSPWRVWWVYDPEPDTLTAMSLGPHP